VRRVLFAVWVVMQAALCGGCGPHDPAAPDLSRFAWPPTVNEVNTERGTPPVRLPR
jgi:hypothetical protein